MVRNAAGCAGAGLPKLLLLVPPTVESGIGKTRQILRPLLPQMLFF